MCSGTRTHACLCFLSTTSQATFPMRSCSSQPPLRPSGWHSHHASPLSPKLRSDPGCRSNPIAHRVRRKRQRLPPSLLIENASDRDPAPSPAVSPRRFRSRLATTRPETVVLRFPGPVNSAIHVYISESSRRRKIKVGCRPETTPSVQ